MSSTDEFWRSFECSELCLEVVSLPCKLRQCPMMTVFMYSISPKFIWLPKFTKISTSQLLSSMFALRYLNFTIDNLMFISIISAIYHQLFLEKNSISVSRVCSLIMPVWSHVTSHDQYRHGKPQQSHLVEDRENKRSLITWLGKVLCSAMFER